MRLPWILLPLCAGSLAVAGEWERLPSLPDREGFAGSFAGVSHGTLLVAGGANFPDKKPWEGGRKVWSDAVFALDRPDGAWKIAGRLARPLGYGVSVTNADGMICVGGSDADRHYADAFRLEWAEGRLARHPLPSLPVPIANACGALIGETLYIAGGQESPESRETLKRAWALDLRGADLSWREIEPWPGTGRMLAIAAGFDGAFWLIGGAEFVGGTAEKPARRYLKDAYRFDPGAGWSRIADLPCPVAAAPTPAFADASGFEVFGGDDGSQVDCPPGEHRGFRKEILRYELKTGAWSGAGELPVARVTTPLVRWGRSWVIPSGEARPGIRSPEVWRLMPGNEE